MTTRDALLALLTVALMAISGAASLGHADAAVMAARVGFSGDPRDSAGPAPGIAPTVALPAPSAPRPAPTFAPKTLKNKLPAATPPSGCGSVPCLQG